MLLLTLIGNSGRQSNILMVAETEREKFAPVEYKKDSGYVGFGSAGSVSARLKAGGYIEYRDRVGRYTRPFTPGDEVRLGYGPGSQVKDEVWRNPAMDWLGEMIVVPDFGPESIAHVLERQGGEETDREEFSVEPDVGLELDKFLRRRFPAVLEALGRTEDAAALRALPPVRTPAQAGAVEDLPIRPYAGPPPSGRQATIETALDRAVWSVQEWTEGALESFAKSFRPTPLKLLEYAQSAIARLEWWASGGPIRYMAEGIDLPPAP